jgi:hypothetical protein
MRISFNGLFIIVYLWCDFTKMRISFNGLFINCVFMLWFHKIADFISWFIHLLCIYVVISQNCGIHFMVYSFIVYLRCNFTKLRNSFHGLFIYCVFMMWFHKNAEFISWLFIIVYLWLCFYDVISQKCGIYFMVIYNCIFMIVFLWCDFTKMRNSFNGYL